MGFFSDLKEDLSQAVNELMPEESRMTEESAQETAVAEGEAVTLTGYEKSDLDDLYSESYAKADEPEKDATESFHADLNEMLSHVEEISVPAQESAEEEVYVAPVIPEKPVFETNYAGRVAADEVSVIMESMIINGNIATEGALDIRGSIVGDVEALGKLNITGTIQGNSRATEVFAEGAKITGEIRSQGAIKVGQSSVIIGDVFATSAVIAGAIKGDIDVKGPVILDSSAIVMGNIKSKSVQINNGAVIEGMCSQCYAEVNPTSFFEELKKMK